MKIDSSYMDLTILWAKNAIGKDMVVLLEVVDHFKSIREV